MPTNPPNTNPVNVPTVYKSYSFVLSNSRVYLNTLQMVGMAVRAPPFLDFANVLYISQFAYIMYILLLLPKRFAETPSEAAPIVAFIKKEKKKKK
jgi:hypothetical protein